MSSKDQGSVPDKLADVEIQTAVDPLSSNDASNDDADDRIRPFGFNKTPQIEMCAMCGKDKTTAGIQLANCGGCRRVKYCST